MTTLAIEGATDEAIANQLSISVKTVKRHLTSAYSKLASVLEELQKPLQSLRAQMSWQTGKRGPVIGAH